MKELPGKTIKQRKIDLIKSGNTLQKDRELRQSKVWLHMTVISTAVALLLTSFIFIK